MSFSTDPLKKRFKGNDLYKMGLIYLQTNCDCEEQMEVLVVIEYVQ